MKGQKRTDEQKERMRIAQIGNRNRAGKSFSIESKEKIRNSLKGRKLSEETKRKMSESMKKKKMEVK